MICNQLESIGLTPSALRSGGSMHELNCRSELSNAELDTMHNGKESSITHILGGGSGFPISHYTSHSAAAAFDGGCTIERRDFRSMLVWSKDLAQCLTDRKCGRVE